MYTYEHRYMHLYICLYTHTHTEVYACVNSFSHIYIREGGLIENSGVYDRWGAKVRWDAHRNVYLHRGKKSRGCY